MEKYNLGIIVREVPGFLQCHKRGCEVSHILAHRLPTKSQLQSSS